MSLRRMKLLLYIYIWSFIVVILGTRQIFFGYPKWFRHRITAGPSLVGSKTTYSAAKKQIEGRSVHNLRTRNVNIKFQFGTRCEHKLECLCLQVVFRCLICWMGSHHRAKKTMKTVLGILCCTSSHRGSLCWTESVNTRRW